jgi:hypothetical protein
MQSGHQRAAAFSIAVLIASGGCSSSSRPVRSSSVAGGGALAGTLQLRGGPAPRAVRAVSGEVYAFTSSSLAGAPAATTKAGNDGGFSLSLPPGTY